MFIIIAVIKSGNVRFPLNPASFPSSRPHGAQQKVARNISSDAFSRLRPPVYDRAVLVSANLYADNWTAWLQIFSPSDRTDAVPAAAAGTPSSMCVRAHESHSLLCAFLVKPIIRYCVITSSGARSAERAEKEVPAKAALNVN